MRLIPLVLSFLLILSAGTAVAQSKLHPQVPLLDADGLNVLESGEPVSTLKTCGDCHDVDYITSNSYHVMAGLDEIIDPTLYSGIRDWDQSGGHFGKWNPVTYRNLTSLDSDIKSLDLSTPDWIVNMGTRHAGNGPSLLSRRNIPLEDLSPDLFTVENSKLDLQTGAIKTWNWLESGVMEMNCFICHLQNPSIDEKNRIIADGKFKWAATATLASTGVVNWDSVDEKFVYQLDKFNPDGNLTADILMIQDPKSDNCGSCHMNVYYGEDPFMASRSVAYDSTQTKGEVFSPQRINESGLNIKGKINLGRPWDIHAERMMHCTNCHYSINNPVYHAESDDSKPDHLSFDARRIDFGDYIERPSHNFAKGYSSNNSYADPYDGSMRRCEDCHEPRNTHEWLPYKNRHFDALSCEVCHIPDQVLSAYKQVDWTVLNSNGDGVFKYRGIDGNIGDTASLITGYQPVLLPRNAEDGSKKLFPHNVISSWYWFDNTTKTPVNILHLRKAFFAGGIYHPDIVRAFDSDNNQQISENELILDSQNKIDAVRNRLKAVGVSNPVIYGEIEPYGLHHNVVTAEWSTKDCNVCHSPKTRLKSNLELTDYIPSAEKMTGISSDAVIFSIEHVKVDGEALNYDGSIEQAGLYVFGHSRDKYADLAGLLIVLGVLAGSFGHALLRIFNYMNSRRKID